MYSSVMLESGLVKVVGQAVKGFEFPDQTGALVPVNVYAGEIPRDGAGQIATSEVEEYPSVTIEVGEEEVGKVDSLVTVEMFLGAYEAQGVSDMSGHQYVLNMWDAIKLELCRHRKIAGSYPLEFPLHFRQLGRDNYPVFAGVITAKYKSVTPDSDTSDSIYKDY
jgi:hypothetical protein